MKIQLLHTCKIQNFDQSFDLGVHIFSSHKEAIEYMNKQVHNVTEAIRENILIMGTRGRIEGATAMDATGAQHFWKIKRVPDITMEGGG